MAKKRYFVYATIEDVATTLGKDPKSLTTVKQEQIEDWVAKTERIIKKRLGSLELLDKDDLRDVISEVVARRVRNPDGKQNERLDDYGYGLDKEVAKGRLYLTDDEWDQLTPTVIDRSVGITFLTGNSDYGPSARSAYDHPVRGWWT